MLFNLASHDVGIGWVFNIQAAGLLVIGAKLFVGFADQ